MTLQRALFISLGGHGVLLTIFILSINLTQTKPVAMLVPHTTEPMKAIAVNQQQVAIELQKLKAAENRQRQLEQERVQQLQRQAKQARDQAIQEQKRLAQLAAARRKQELEQQQLAAKAKQLKVQQAAEQQRLATLKKQQEAKALEQKLHAEEQALLVKRLREEQQQLSAARSRQELSEINKYTTLITHAIGRQWIQPENTSRDISCVLFIRLAPNGEVLDVQLIATSGDSVLDRSAVVAVYKASPLPVPEDPELSTKFREIRLKVKPEGYLM